MPEPWLSTNHWYYQVGCVVVLYDFEEFICLVSCLSSTPQLTGVDLLLCGALNFYFKLRTSYRNKPTAHCSKIVKIHNSGT
jgi:hypothetical protein